MPSSPGLTTTSAAIAAGFLACIAACATPKKMVLISNKEDTVFTVRVVPGSGNDAAMRGASGEARAGVQDYTRVGVGKYVDVETKPAGSYEIVATALGYPSMSQTILSDPALPSRVQFTFIERGRTPTGLEPRYKEGYAHRYAVVVGINNYSHWKRLEGARDDARRVAKRFRELGFDEVLELYDGDATREGILRLIGESLSRRTVNEDMVVFYFAGHGQTETLASGQKQGYIIPVEARRNSSFSTAISMQELRSLRERTPAKHMLYLMDSCYSGLILARGGSGEGQPSEDGYGLTWTTYKASQILVAGQEGQVALEQQGVGLFSKYLLRALEGEADSNHDGKVTALEIATFVDAPVIQESKGHQTPQFGWVDVGSGNVVFDLH